MGERALPFDDDTVGAFRRGDDELLGRAGDEVGDDRVHGDPAPGDHDAGLPCRYELRAAAAAAKLGDELE